MSEPTYATAPFDHIKADIILRSSDGTYFRVFKLFLSLASPLFQTLFEIPQPADPSVHQEIKDGLVVVPVTERSKTLDTLLRFCYPCTLADDPQLDVLEDLLDVLSAAKKYSLDVIEKKARQAVVTPTILRARPLQCFAITHQGLLREECILAAKHTLTQPLIPAWFQGIELITAEDLLALLTYHKRCGEAVYALRADLSWVTSHYGGVEACNWFLGQYKQELGKKAGVCGCPKSTTLCTFSHGSYLPVRWWEKFMDDTFTELRDKPCAETVQAATEKTIGAVKKLNCFLCSPKVTEAMRDFSDLLVRKVDEAVSQISLDLLFF